MTSFDQIIDLALVTVNDYKLIKLYKRGEDEFKTWCDGFLISAIPNFFHCKQSLKYDKNARQFEADLNDVEVRILADFWIISWMERETQDSTKINNLLQTSGSFKTHSASQNLKEKSVYLDGLREKVYQKIMDYQVQDIANISI